MIPEPWMLLLAIGTIALLAGFVHSAIGFGFGIVAVSLLPLVVDIRQSHVVISVASVPVLMMAAWSYREGADWNALWRALLGAAISMPLGLLAFEWLSMDWLMRGTGIAILVMVWTSFRNQRLAKRSADAEPSHRWAPFLAGTLGGFIAGAVSIAGPPVAAFALQQGWNQARFKAFLNQFLLAVSFYKVLGLAVRSHIDLESLTQATMLAPMAIVGIWLGARVSGKISPYWFQRVVAVVLVCLAISFLMKGW